MPRDGTGQYNLPNTAVVTGTPIDPNDENTTRDDIATALTGSMPRDGQAAMTGNLPMGGFRITGLAAPAALGDGARRDTVAWERISLVSGSTPAATIDIPIPAGFRRVRLSWQDTVPAAAAQFGMRISIDNGVSFLSGASDYGLTANACDGAANTPYGGAASFAALTPATTGKTSGSIEIGILSATQMDFRGIAISTVPALTLTTGCISVASGPATNLRLFFTGGINASAWNFLLEGQRT